MSRVCGRLSIRVNFLLRNISFKRFHISKEGKRTENFTLGNVIVTEMVESWHWKFDFFLLPRLDFVVTWRVNVMLPQVTSLRMTIITVDRRRLTLQLTMTTRCCIQKVQNEWKCHHQPVHERFLKYFRDAVRSQLLLCYQSFLHLFCVLLSLHYQFSLQSTHHHEDLETRWYRIENLIMPMLTDVMCLRTAMYLTILLTTLCEV